ncbi:MAG: Brp/Blh family beta-carotene 15,15'-dioxygenase, partial [Bacteroidota bacterium]
MHCVPHRHGGVSPYVLILTVGFAFTGFVVPNFLGVCEPFLVLGLMLMLGLPHGATDHGLFDALIGNESGKRGVSFYLAYLLVIGAYGLVWFLLPVVAFGVFILMSVYHFGQSNWADVGYASATQARLHYLLWGAGVLLTPIILHGGEASTIVATMTDFTIPAPGTEMTYAIIASLAGLNVLVVVALRVKGQLSTRRLIKEVLGYGILTLMFFTNTLLLGFTVYFVFWHSLTSAQDQARFFERRLSPIVRKQLYVEIATVVFGALGFCLIVWFGPGPEAALQPGVIGGVFIFISLVTLPHMLLVEQLYNSWSPQQEATILSLSPNRSKSSLTKPQTEESSSTTSGLSII